MEVVDLTVDLTASPPRRHGGESPVRAAAAQPLQDDDDDVVVVTVNDTDAGGEGERCDHCQRQVPAGEVMLLSGCGHEVCKRCLGNVHASWLRSLTDSMDRCCGLHVASGSAGGKRKMAEAGGEKDGANAGSVPEIHTMPPSLASSVFASASSLVCPVARCGSRLERDVFMAAGDAVERGDAAMFAVLRAWFGKGTLGTSIACEKCNAPLVLISRKSQSASITSDAGTGKGPKQLTYRLACDLVKVHRGRSVSGAAGVDGVRRMMAELMGDEDGCSMYICVKCTVKACGTCGAALGGPRHTCGAEAEFCAELYRDALSGLDTGAADAAAAAKRMKASAAKSKSASNAASHPVSHGNGVGYGGSFTELWGRAVYKKDTMAAEKGRKAAQNRQESHDQKTQRCFERILLLLERAKDGERDGGGGGPRSASAGDARNDILFRWYCFCCLLDASSLQSAVTSLLVNDSFMDISERSELYMCLMKLLRELSLLAGCTTILSSLGKRDDGEAGGLASGYSEAVKGIVSLVKQARLFLKHTRDDGSVTELARHFVEAGEEIEKRVKTVLQKRYKTLPEATAARGGGASTSGPQEGDGAGGSKAAQEREARYVHRLEKLKFQDGQISNCKKYYFHDKAKALQSSLATSMRKERSNRLAKEIATISGGSCLPLTLDGGSIFIVADGNRPDCLRALIIPSSETPYANGVFVFDLFAGGSYPDAPPEVQFLTTGGGSMRFNPNLYESGKVCLSLLGTWPGPGWDRKQSTIIQVFVSILNFIFVSEPFFNEPGFERNQGTTFGKKSSDSYNRTIRQYTMRAAILNSLRDPPKFFEKIVQRHFALKKDAIEKQCKEWTKLDPNNTDLRNSVAGVREELRKL